jgi:hypothetical protein
MGSDPIPKRRAAAGFGADRRAGRVRPIPKLHRRSGGTARSLSAYDPAQHAPAISDIDERRRLRPQRSRLSVQRALIGNVSPALYGACAALEGNQIILTWYVSPDLTDDERDDLYGAGAQVIGDFPDDYRIDEHFVQVSDRTKPLKTVGYWVLLQSDFRTIESW